ncbi:MAG: hypothetical protein HYT16_02760 [DPANN group archaeon]|nr:hypothetical protein [DPANN group archaeon]
MVTQPQEGYQTAVAWGMLSADQQGLVKNELLNPTQSSLEGIIGTVSQLGQNPQLVLGQLPTDAAQREAAVKTKEDELKGKLRAYVKLMIAEPMAKAYGITNVDMLLDTLAGPAGEPLGSTIRAVAQYLPLLAKLRGAMLIKAYETAPTDVKGQVGAALVKNYASGLEQATEQMMQRAQRGQAG